MNLCEQYETLLRRGMPELDRNGWDGPWVAYNTESQSWEMQDPDCDFYGPELHKFYGRSDKCRMLEAHARDLITMHALRWVNGLHNVHWRNGLHYSTGDGEKTLTNILAATAHLEPK